MTPAQLVWFGRLWTKAEDAALRRQFRAGIAVERISVIGRTVKAIVRRGYALGLVRRRRVIRRWSPAERQLFQQLAKEQGLSANRIKALGHFPNRTLGALATMKRYLGYVSALQSDRARHTRQLTGGELERFRRFLRGPGRRTPTAEIVERFGVSTSMVWRNRHRLKCPLTVEQSRLLPQNQRRRRRAHRVSVATLRERNADRRAELIAALRQQGAAMAQNGNGAPLRKCQRCQQVWPLTDSFFIAFTRQGGATYRCFQRTCRLCRNCLPAPLLSSPVRA